MSIDNAFAALSSIADYALAPVKVAIFDANGDYIGWMENRADLLALHEADEYTRIPWRPEWDTLKPIPAGDTLPLALVLRLPIPNLSELADE